VSFFAEFILRGERFFAALRMTECEGLRMTECPTLNVEQLAKAKGGDSFNVSFSCLLWTFN
jgi:hypothetical protein